MESTVEKLAVLKLGHQNTKLKIMENLFNKWGPTDLKSIGPTMKTPLMGNSGKEDKSGGKIWLNLVIKT